MTKPGWGILSTGGIARTFTKDLLENGHHVAAVGSRSNEAATRFAAEFNLARRHGSYEALVADPSVDVVYVATPHVFHAEHAALALEAGKHVLVEKPFTLNAAEAQAVVDLARRRGLVVLEAMWTRFLPHMVRIRELLASGLIGDVSYVSADHLQMLTQDRSYHRMSALDLGGGALLDLGVYPISFAHDLLGNPKSIQASSRMIDTGVDAAIATVIKHDAGGVSMAMSAMDLRGANHAKVVASRGWIEIEGTWYFPTNFRVFDQNGKLVELYRSEVQARGMQYEAAEMERLMAEAVDSVIMPPDQSVAVMRTLDQIRAQIGLVYPQEASSASPADD